MTSTLRPAHLNTQQLIQSPASRFDHTQSLIQSPAVLCMLGQGAQPPALSTPP